MKAALFFGAIFAILAFSIPLLAIPRGMPKEAAVSQHTPGISPPAVSVAAPSRPEPEPDPVNEPEPSDEPEVEVEAEAEREPIGGISANGVLSFRILDQSTGRINEVGLRDYVRGAVASEMPANFHSEALKAQAVAAHTYALYHHRMQQRSPDPSLRGADFAADPSRRSGYMTEAAARKFYGDNADLYWDKICEAVDSVLPYIMEYEEEPIVAAYHAISAGKTESASNVWSGSAPYLVPAESIGCLLAPDYEVSTAVPVETVRKTLLGSYPDMKLPQNPARWFGEPERSESGYITAITVGDIEMHGKTLRELFDLRSHNLDIATDGSEFVFTAYGHGHGVGLSQYGADYLARQGYRFDQILDNYYQGITIRQVDFDVFR